MQLITPICSEQRKQKNKILDDEDACLSMHEYDIDENNNVCQGLINNLNPSLCMRVQWK